MTVSETLRTAIVEDVTFNHLAVTSASAADTIDALVAALEKARGALTASAKWGEVNAEISGAHYAIDAALALARGEK